MTVRLRRVSSQEDLKKAFAIRERVFVKEQGVPQTIEKDRDDARAIHFLAFESNTAVGTARVVIDRRSAKIGRMAVLRKHRGKGIGKKLLRRALAAATKRGVRQIYLHAQVPVVGFYESMGFRSSGELFAEAGIPHRKMFWSKRPSRKLK